MTHYDTESNILISEIISKIETQMEISYSLDDKTILEFALSEYLKLNRRDKTAGLYPTELLSLPYPEFAVSTDNLIRYNQIWLDLARAISQKQKSDTLYQLYLLSLLGSEIRDFCVAEYHTMGWFEHNKEWVGNMLLQKDSCFEGAEIWVKYSDDSKIASAFYGQCLHPEGWNTLGSLQENLAIIFDEYISSEGELQELFTELIYKRTYPSLIQQCRDLNDDVESGLIKLSPIRYFTWTKQRESYNYFINSLLGQSLTSTEPLVEDTVALKYYFRFPGEVPPNIQHDKKIKVCKGKASQYMVLIHNLISDNITSAGELGLSICLKLNDSSANVLSTLYNISAFSSNVKYENFRKHTLHKLGVKPQQSVKDTLTKIKYLS